MVGIGEVLTLQRKDKVLLQKNERGKEWKLGRHKQYMPTTDGHVRYTKISSAWLLLKTLFMYDNQLEELGAPFDWACNTPCHFPAYIHCYNHLFFPVKFQIPSCSSPCHFLQLHLQFPSFPESYVPITQWDLEFLEHIILFHIYESLHVPHPLLGMEWPCLFLVCLENSLTLFKHVLLRNASLMPSYSCHPSPPPHYFSSSFWYSYCASCTCLYF